ncbi:TPA: DUF262 domain-containing protein [Bacillus luti]|nr:DUF262 domain-containing protein [Bacillus luti]
MTFSKLLEEYRIVIPMIQRDYAQGRKDDKATLVRENLIENMKVALLEGKSLDFDFIYGTIEDCEGKETLLPLDGQQRLTTLFLLHWYLNMKEGGDMQPELEKFSYETRITAKDFVYYLVRNSIEYDAKPLSKVIESQKWYQYKWKFDPTVEGMLRMLDKIHEEFYKIENGLLEVLRGDECPIFFTFKDLKNIGSGEELYIKMNARGRALSDFENFKAQFEQLLEVLGYKDKAKEFSFTLDREWTDFLWPYLDDSKTLDKPFLRLFNFISSSKVSRTGAIASNTFHKDYTNFKELSTIYKDEENVTFLFDIFTIWKDAEQIESEFSSIHEQIHLFTDERNYFKALVEEDNLTWPERIYLYAIIQSKIYKREDEIELLRVVRNIVNRIRQAKDGKFTSNMRYDTIPTLFNFIDYLVEAEKTVYEAILDIPPKMFSKISDASLKHEQDKAKFILERPDLKEWLCKLEDNIYFKGALMVVLPIFKKYPENLYDVMQELLSANQSLVSRAFLTIGDYAHHIGYTNLGARYIFGGDAVKEYIWTTYDSDLQVHYEDFLERLITLEDDKIENKLKQLIQEQEWDQADWKYYFVKYPTILTGKRMIFSYDDNDELLIEKLSGVSLRAEHINPIYKVVIESIPTLCDSQSSNVRLSERSKLVTKNGLVLHIANGKWQTDDDELNDKLIDIQKTEKDLVQQVIKAIHY